MKKTSAILLVLIALAITACGAKSVPQTPVEEEAQIEPDYDGFDGYKPLEWHFGDESKTINARIFDESGYIYVYEDSDDYAVISACYMPKKYFGDREMALESLHCEDIDGDGFDDICVTDMVDGGEMDYVFFWNDGAQGFWLPIEEYDAYRLIGAWSIDGDTDTARLHIDYNGDVTGYYADGNVEFYGDLFREVVENDDGTTEAWFYIYESGSGKYWMSFRDSGDEVIDEFYTGYESSVRYARIESMG